MDYKIFLNFFMRFFHFDWWLFFVILALSGLGMLVQLSVAPDLFLTQLSFMLFGLFLFILFSSLPAAIIFSFKNLFYPAMLIALLITFIVGIEVRGSTRWLNLAGVNLQPSELIKPFYVIFLALLFSEEGERRKKLLKAFLLTLPILLLIFKQPDLGNTLVYAFIFLAILLAEKYYKIILAGTLITALLLPFFWNLLHGYQKNRILTFINPDLDPQGTGYNALQSTIAVGSGGFFGKGIGKGTQSHLQFLPEHHTDFIFASFAEEFGFIGAFTLILLYGILLSRLLAICQQAGSKEEILTIIGIFSFFTVQIFVNIGMNIGAVPITGITLPFLSYGGSSLLAAFISLGIAESIAKGNKKAETLMIK